MCDPALLRYAQLSVSACRRLVSDTPQTERKLWSAPRRGSLFAEGFRKLVRPTNSREPRPGLGAGTHWEFVGHPDGALFKVGVDVTVTRCTNFAPNLKTGYDGAFPISLSAARNFQMRRPVPDVA